MSSTSSRSRGLKRSNASLDLCSEAEGCPCNRCKRPRTTPNPIKCARYPGETLPFRPGSSTCIPCVNFTQKNWRGKPVEELDASINESDENQQKYNAGLVEYEEAYVEAEQRGGRIKKSKEFALDFASTKTVQDDKMVFDKDLGNFWPMPLFLEWHAKDKKLQTEQPRFRADSTQESCSWNSRSHTVVQLHSHRQTGSKLSMRGAGRGRGASQILHKRDTRATPRWRGWESCSTSPDKRERLQIRIIHKTAPDTC